MNDHEFQTRLTSNNILDPISSLAIGAKEYQSNFLGESLRIEPQGMPLSEGRILGNGNTSKEDAVIDAGVARLKSNLINLTEESTFEATLTTAFGEQVDTELAKELLYDLVEGKRGPELRVIDGDLLLGQGAFGNDTIFISDDLLVGSAQQPEFLDRVLLEEAGHYLDQVLNDMDSPGDEGEVFANLVQGNSLSGEELAFISIEDDSSTIFVDNQLISVENNIGSYPGYIFKYEGGQSLSYDSNVEDWQQAMNDLGWDIEVDGLYGSESRSAALEFQQKHADLVNDGIVGENTWNKTLDLLNEETNSGTKIPKTIPETSISFPPTVEDYIDLVEKVEEAYPELTTNEVLAALRSIGKGSAPYDDANFQRLYDTEPGKELKPKGDLTEQDLNLLIDLTTHDFVDGVEKGIVLDSNGESVAIGHVITGLTGGINYRSEVSFQDKGIITHRVDNLFTSTLSGDLGQSAYEKYSNQQEGNDQYAYIGEDTEASFAELRGDIDGAIIGTVIRKDKNSQLYEIHQQGGSVSQILETYYNSYTTQRYNNALNYLPEKYSDGYLEDQSIRFADNWHKNEDGRDASILGGIFNGKPTENDAKKAVAEYYQWLNEQVDEPQRSTGTF